MHGQNCKNTSHTRPGDPEHKRAGVCDLCFVRFPLPVGPSLHLLWRRSHGVPQCSTCKSMHLRVSYEIQIGVAGARPSCTSRCVRCHCSAPEQGSRSSSDAPTPDVAAQPEGQVRMRAEDVMATAAAVLNVGIS